MEIYQPIAFSPVLDANTQELSNYQCKVCGAHASGFHFGAQSCSACCAFFRRAVSMNKTYKCLKNTTSTAHFLQNCVIHYTSIVICKACRYQKCLTVGMNKEAVKSTQGNNNGASFERRPKRLYWTKSGLKRNKYFAAVGVSTVIKRVEVVAESTSVDYPPPTSILSDIIDSEISTVAGQKAETSKNQNQTIANESHGNDPKTFILPPQNILRILVDEEMRIGERRRILFCERPVASLIGTNTVCVSNIKNDIKPLLFQDFRKSIRTHILLIYEWLRVWPEYGNLSIEDQITLLRKSVLYHTILDPCFITYQMGDPTKFVLQNGGFVSMSEDSNDGWSDESEISQETKKKIYRPLLGPLSEIISQMRMLQITFEEFVSLKTLVTFQMTIPDVSVECRKVLRKEMDVISRSLFEIIQRHHTDSDDQLEGAERFGQIILMQSAIFDTANLFVESHHQVQFFGLWTLDSLMLQFLKNKPF